MITNDEIKSLERKLIAQDDEAIHDMIVKLKETEPVLHEWVSHHFSVPSATRGRMFGIALGAMILLTQKSEGR